MIAGERNPAELAKLRDPRIKASRETIEKSLLGNWREEHLFTLQQSLELYRSYLKQIVAARIKQMSQNVFRVNAGSLFVAFQRLQRAGLINSEWKATENSRRAKYHSLTTHGRKRLKSETEEWGKQVGAIARILEASS